MARAAQPHAQVLGFDHDADAARGEVLVEGVADLLRQALLELRPTGENVHRAREFREPHDPVAGRQVGDVGPAEKGQEVVLAGAVELDSAHDDRLLRGLLEGGCEVARGVLGKSCKHFTIGLGDPSRRIEETIAVRVFADRQHILQQAQKPLLAPALAAEIAARLNLEFTLHLAAFFNA